MKPEQPSGQKDPAGTPNLDAVADKKGETHIIRPEPAKRLLELKGELEHASDEQRVRLQEEIERLQSEQT